MDNGELISQQQIEELKDAFDLFDKNGDGTISVSELKIVLQALGQNPTEATIKEVMAKADKDGNAILDFNEYAALLQSYLKPADVVEVELREAFRIFDKDRNNKLNVQELQRALTYLGDPLTAEEVRELLDLMGVGGDKEVDMEACVKYMCQRY